MCGYRSHDRYEFSSHIARGEHRAMLKWTSGPRDDLRLSFNITFKNWYPHLTNHSQNKLSSKLLSIPVLVSKGHIHIRNRETLSSFRNCIYIMLLLLWNLCFPIRELISYLKANEVFAQYLLQQWHRHSLEPLASQKSPLVVLHETFFLRYNSWMWKSLLSYAQVHWEAELTSWSCWKAMPVCT